MCQNCHHEVLEDTIPPLDPMTERLATVSYQFGYELGKRESAERKLEKQDRKIEELRLENKELRDSLDSVKQARDSYISRANLLEEENLKLKKRRTRR